MNSNKVKFLINIDPIAKGRPRFSKRGFAYTPTKTRQFETMLKKELSKVYTGHLIEDAVKLEVLFIIKRPKSVKKAYPTSRPDLDNYLKALLDAFNGVVLKDDSQVVEFFARKQYGDDGFIMASLQILTPN